MSLSLRYAMPGVLTSFLLFGSHFLETTFCLLWRVKMGGRGIYCLRFLLLWALILCSCFIPAVPLASKYWTPLLFLTFNFIASVTLPLSFRFSPAVPSVSLTLKVNSFYYFSRLWGGSVSVCCVKWNSPFEMLIDLHFSTDDQSPVSSPYSQAPRIQKCLVTNL